MYSVKSFELPVAGRLETHYGFEDQPTGVLRRRLWVYRPEKLGRQPPVVFFLDGQNAFGDDGWRAERAAAKLSRPCLLVGVSNTVRRYPEYIGWSEAEGHRDSVAERHAAYLVDMVVPYIESYYKTGKRRALAGASAGGVAALYTAWSHPGVFKTVASFSAGRHYYRELTRRFKGKPPFRLYLSCGDRGMDVELRPQTEQFARVVKARGGKFLLRLHRGDHSEATWARRMPDFLKYFLDSTRP